MQPNPKFVQAVRTFTGQGLDDYQPLLPAVTYRVPDDREAQCVYFRGGNSSDELICVVLTRDDHPIRLFPIGARASVHIPLRVTEHLLTQSQLELHVAAPPGTTGTVILDLGLLEL